MFLIETTEIYRVDSEDSARDLIEQAKRMHTVKKYNCMYKELKAKGEVVDSWYRVSITKSWDSEKEPCGSTRVSYSEPSAFGGENEEQE